MSNVPPEIQCPQNPEQPCPLLEAKQELEELYATPPERRGTAEGFSARIERIAKELSHFDRGRFYAMQGSSGKRSELRTESCAGGPEKSFIVVGKMACSAQTIFRS